MDRRNLSAAKRFIDALANEHRLEIYRMLLRRKSLSCRDIHGKMALSQPTLSHHLSKLVRARIADVTRKKRTCVYSLNQAECFRTVRFLLPSAGKETNVRTTASPRSVSRKKRSYPFWRVFFS